MSEKLDKMSNAIFNGFVPSEWLRLAPATQKPLGSWMNHFQQRYRQYMEWTTARKEPKVMWLSGLHIPETYLAALVQTVCRKNKWPLDKSTLFTKVTHFKTVNDVPSEMANSGDCCFVRGLFLEGAGWDFEAGSLCKQLPKQLVCELPIVQIIPMESNKVTRQNTFKTPVYVTRQ